MHRSAAILLLLGAPGFVFAEGSEPSPPPAATPLKIETPNEAPTEQTDLPTGAMLRIGSSRSPRMLEGQFAFSPDGKFIAGGTASRFVRVWDVATGKLVRSFGPFTPSGLSSRIICKAVFSPAGEALAVAAGKNVYLYDLTTGKESGQLTGHAHIVEDVAFSKDGKLVATGSFDHTAAIWDRVNCRQLHSLDFADSVDHVAFSQDGETLAATDSKGVIKLVNVRRGTVLKRLDGLKSSTGFVRFIDGGKILLAYGQRDGLIALDVATGVSKRRIRDMQGVAVLSPDGSQIGIVEGYGSTEPVVVWDVKSGKPVAKIKGNHGGAHTVCFSPDNQMLATYGDDGILRYWKLPGGEEIDPPAGHQNRITGVGFTRDGKRLISASSDGTVRFWDAARGKELNRLSAANEYFNALAMSPDSRTLALAGGALPIRWRWGLDESKQSSAVRFVNVESGKEIRSFDIAGETVAAIRFTGDGRQLLAVGMSGVRLIDGASGKSRDPGIRAEQGIPAADVSPDGRYIALSTNVPALRQIGKVAYIDTKDNNEVFSKTFYLGSLSGLAFTPDGRCLAVAGSPGFRNQDKNESPLRLWEVPGDKVTRDFDVNGEHSFHSLVFSRDGRMLAAAKEHGIDVLEVATGKRRHEFAGHEGGIGALAFSRDGQRLVSGGIDGRLMVWDLTGTFGKRISKIEERDLDRLWEDLASENALSANEAIGKMAARPSESAPYLRRRLTILSDADFKRIDALVAELDSNQFRVRDQAAKDLERLGEPATPALKRALTGPSAEVRQAAERLLKKIGDGEDPVTSPEARRAVRAIEILERIGNADAIALLKLLRQRGSKLIVSRDSEAALVRLEAP